MSDVKNPYIGKVFISGTSKVIAIPKKLRELLNINEGDLIEIEVKRKVI